MKGMGNDLIREARKRRRLTQAQLADMAGTTQSAIARLEAAKTAPSFDDVIRYLRLMDLDLDFMLVERDDSDWSQAQRTLAQTPQERTQGHERFLRQARAFRGVMQPDEFDAKPMLEALASHGVQFVLIGGFATIQWSSPFLTQDLDITPERSLANLDRLSDALSELGARVRTPSEPDGVPFPHTGASLSAAGVWNLTTRHGDLDISFVPNGTEGYDDLVQDASELEVFGVGIRVASLADIIRSKQAANRPKDQRVLPTLREILASRHEKNR